ncbi:hypothetical protein ELI00_06475 [Rhizobium ruizarguesonis]|uniref:GTPase n=1 Tax=Rhizobium ruizarguesonis TaxID=2081791 RepID=UPI0010309524|nr:GTPase [Rhizobium ruizarguesonis]TAX75920.1 hypothetical protein ELI00_06475 [Rhizobium ruizarguesonis]TBA79863.1 hypothetical protein ELH56_06290 [Rhizobium ruizarguesonis]
MNRRWSSWPKRFGEQANSSGGVVGLVSGLGTMAATAIGLPLVITAAPAAITVGAVGYCLFKSWPEKSLKAAALVGTTITSLSDLWLIEPQLTRVGFVGPSQAGKTTTLSNLSARHASPNVRTDNPYATVTLVPGQPTKHFALVDAAGQQFAQQFKVAENSDLLFIFLDHALGETIAQVSDARLREHEQFLEQMRGYLKQQKSPVSSIHFILNKRDKWENGPDAELLTNWFQSQVNPWKQAPGLTVTHSYHSNFITSDNISMANILRDRVK